MAFQIIRNDITKMHTDAIVNTANPEVLVGDGVDRAIYQAAGAQEMLNARKGVGVLAPGEVGVTPGFHLPAKYVIHVSGVFYEGTKDIHVLEKCYENSLQKALELSCNSIAFPFLATGTYGFPKDVALGIAVSIFQKFLMNHEMEIFLVIFDDESVHVSEKLFHQVERFVDSHYVEEGLSKEYQWSEYSTMAPKPANTRNAERRINDSRKNKRIFFSSEASTPFQEEDYEDDACTMETPCKLEAIQKCKNMDDFLDDAAIPLEEYLQQLINKKGMTNAEVYGKANLDKKYFSKLMNGKVHPTKPRLLSIAVALELNIDETVDFLRYAGYALAPNNKTDLVFQYFISHGKYNIYDVDIALFDMGLPTLVND